MRKKGTGEEWERVRNVAINLLDQGMTPAQVALAVEVHVQTVRAWHRAYMARGTKALRSTRPPGRPAALSPGQRTELAELLLKTPAECGFDKYLWTQELIAQLIDREFGVKYHHDHVGRILAAIGFTHQKPARRAREPDQAKVDDFRDNRWPELQKKTPPKTA